ncbi:MAG: hypothetical protein V3W52_17195 [Syntrophobacteria bacterium]
MRVDIKPLSVNRAWQGRRYKTPEYNRYIADLMVILRPYNVPEGELSLTLTFGFSNKASDFDNPVKPFVDCLQKRYGFNDRMIKRCLIQVEHVKKGEEFIEWDIKPLA